MFSFPIHLAMHIPDGYLSLPVSLGTGGIAIALIALALNRVQSEYKERTVPLMGVSAAFIFAAQIKWLIGKYPRNKTKWYKYLAD